MKQVNKCILFFLFFATASSGIVYAQDPAAISVYANRLNDPKAVYLDKANFPVKGDGIGDDAPALQQAINALEAKAKAGIVFIPEGTYRLASTVNIWKGIRLIGYGKQRPVLLLSANSPGFQSGDGNYMIRFCDRRMPEGSPIMDGTPGTLFSGLSNINFRIEDGNPAAIAVRFHVAQHSFLEHIDFNIGSARAAINEMGNEIRDCRFYGGEWAIKTGLTSAGWQALVMDCYFDGQRTRAIETKDAGMTVIRCRFRNTLSAITVLQGNNEKLFVKDTWFENIADAAINIGNYYDPKTQVNLEALRFSNVPVSVNFSLLPGVITSISKDSLRRKADGPVYTIEHLSHGLHIECKGPDIERTFVTQSQHETLNSLGDFAIKDVPDLPAQSTWVNIMELGAKGDGRTDDTQVFMTAIKKYETIYIPGGTYLLSESLVLLPATALIGLHPVSTKFILADSSRLFSDTNNPKPILITPKGGRNIINGIGIDAGYNPGAIAIQWMSGARSLLNDVHLPSNRSPIKGMGQYYGVWVTAGGGGIFKSSWFPNERARSGFFVSNTSTPGAVYMLSVEHHKQVEVKLDHVSNWTFYSLQTEEDLGSDRAFAVTMNACDNLHFTNMFCYRRALMPAPFISAVGIRQSHNIRISGLHSFSSGPFPYDNAVYLMNNGGLVPQTEFAKFILY